LIITLNLYIAGLHTSKESNRTDIYGKRKKNRRRKRQLERKRETKIEIRREIKR